MPELHGPFVLDVVMPTVKSLDPEDGDILIEGYAADFEMDRQGEKFLVGAFDDACQKASEGSIPLLLEHDNGRVLGAVETLKTDDRGLYVQARIAAEAAKTAWPGAEGQVEMIRRGVMKGLSVRGHSWGRMTPEGPEIGHIDLAEISVTPVPVQPGALFTVTQKSMDYAVNPDSNPDIAWAAQGWADVLDQYSEEEIAGAIETYYKKRIGELKSQLKRCKALLSNG